MNAVRQASHVLLLVYIVTTLLALAPTELSHPLASALSGGAPTHATLERLHSALPSLRLAAYVLLAFALLAFLLSAWLTPAWLFALERPRSLRACLSAARRLYWPTLTASALLVVVLALGIAALAGLGALWHLMTRGPDARTHDLGLIVLAAAACGGLWLWSAWHDLTRAALTRAALPPVVPAQGTPGRPLRALGTGLRAMGRRTLLPYASWQLAAALLATLGYALGTSLDGPDPWRPWLATAVLQTLVLCRLATRAAWLRVALGRFSETEV